MNKKNSGKKLRVLFITEFLPWPLNSGGRIRSFHMLRQVCLRHNVTLVAACYGDVPAPFQGMVDELYALPIKPRTKWSKIFGAAVSVLSRKPYLNAFCHFRQEMADAVATIVSSNKFDLIHFDHLDSAVYLTCCGNNTFYLDEHNFETKLVKSIEKSTTNVLLKWYLRQQLIKLEMFETAMLRSADAVGAVSIEDGEQMSEAGGERVKLSVVPNGVDLNYFDGMGQPIPGRIVSVGSLDWRPNVEGLIWFLDKVWPVIHSRCPSSSFQIVGRNPPRVLLERTDNSVLIAANVPDVRDYMKSACAFVVPLFAGGGTRLKVLEAMAMRIPVIATPIGVEGIECQDGRDVLVAEQVTDFSNKVLQVLESGAVASALASAARKLVENKYSWDAVGDRLDAIYGGIVPQ